ncbi:unnamed protein product [Mycena citricolor]|uniref:Major facilitator superfamily (MFS) profile domain-containing protein n=1 Tax=Mycena citricolor TaxID=2018698 RepID=A0AAD2H9E1_9AGAR|nr:unnamed protein product [Mycena citricolor]
MSATEQLASRDTTPTVAGDESGRDKERDSESLDDIIVDWDGPDDPQNPKNWSKRKKWAATLVISLFTLISPLSSSVTAPASQKIAKEFGITSEVEIALLTSIFVLAYAIGPLFLGPLSEIIGRSRTMQGANLFYLLWNFVCGWARNKGELLAFRFLAGIGGSAPLAIGGAVLGDIWKPEERGQAIALFSLAPLLGPVIGPVCGAFIAERTTWRWVFWATSAFTVLIQLLGVLFIRESYPPVLLEQRAERMRKAMDSEKGRKQRIRSVFATEERSWKKLLKTALTRPFILLYNEPIVQILALYMAFIYGVFYLFLTSMSVVFEQVYHEQVGIAGLNYIALGVGVTLSSQINARAMDRIYVALKARNGGAARPEYRLPSMVPGTFALPIGLFLTGWTVQNKVHWIVPDIGIAFVGMGVILNFQSIQIYLIDAFTLYAASALAAASFLRSICGFGFPLFAQSMYNKLGYGTGDSILGAVAIVIGCPAPWVLWKYGAQIRARSRFAAKQGPVASQK